MTLRAHIPGDGHYIVRGANKQPPDAGGISTVDLAVVGQPPPGSAGIVAKSFNAQAIVAATPVAIWTPAASKRFRLMGGSFSVSAATAIIFKDAAALTGILSPLLAIAGIFTLPPLGGGYLSAAANNPLNIDVTASATLTGFVWGYEE